MMSADFKQRLQLATASLDALGPQVEKMLAYAEDVPYKRIPLFTSVAAKFAYGDFTYKEVTWVNGGDDFFICGLSYMATLTQDTPPVDPYLPGVEAPFDRDLGQVMFNSFPLSTFLGDHEAQFDFMWNYRVMSTGANYGSVANGTTFLPRQLLGNRERGAPLEFDSPLRLKGGDAITFLIKPVWFGSHGGQNAEARYVIEMVPWGYRTGRMAESAFDREVEG